jgi:hypothetical protein
MNGHLDRLRRLRDLLPRDVSDLEDYRVASPLNTIVPALMNGPTYEPIETWLPKVYAGWVERFGEETTDAVIDAYCAGTLTWDPSRVQWGKYWRGSRPMKGRTHG